MQSNVIAFPAFPKKSARRPVQRHHRDNVVSLASWIGRAMPRRTPTGVFFSTGVLITPGEIA